MIKETTSNIFDASIQLESFEYFNSKVKSVVDTRINNGIFGEGCVVAPLSDESQEMVNLLIKSGYIGNEKSPSIERLSYSDLFNDVTDELVTISKGSTWRESIGDICAIKSAMGENFYGALLINGKTIINPLHPITALALNKSDEFDNTKFRVVIYAYQNRGYLDQKYYSETADMTNIMENISNQITCFNNMSEPDGDETEKITIITRNSFDSENSIVPPYADISYSEITERASNVFQNGNKILVTHQILTAGIVAPYYGTSIINMSRDVSGISVAPMHSCNIGEAENEPDFSSPRFNSVCTGSLRKDSIEGLRSLTHANTSSPFYRKIIEQGALKYADACVDYSLTIYKMNDIISQEDCPDTIEEVTEEISSVKEEEELPHLNIKHVGNLIKEIAEMLEVPLHTDMSREIETLDSLTRTLLVHEDVSDKIKEIAYKKLRQIYIDVANIIEQER